MKVLLIRCSISLVALSVAACHLIWPHLKVDLITITLLAIAVVPWLESVFESLELPGGWKLKFRELTSVAERAKAAGLLAPEPQAGAKPEHSFQLVAEADPNLALAGLRIEMEKRLIQLAESNAITMERKGISHLLRELNQHEVINGAERSILSDLATLLNSAVHGAKVDRRSADWALEIGPRILGALEERVLTERTDDQGIV